MAKLNEALVPFSLWRHEQNNGILVAEQHLALTLHLLRRVLVAGVEDERNGVCVTCLEEADSEPVPPGVISLAWSGSPHDYFTPELFAEVVEEVLLPAVDKPILLTGYRMANNPRPIYNGMVYVHVWASSKGNCTDGNGNIPETLFGLSCKRNMNWFAPANVGEVIRDPGNDCPVAEIIGDNVYIFPPVNIKTVGNGVEIFRKILEKVADWFSLSSSERYAKERERSRLSFIKASMTRFSRNHATLVEKIKGQESLLTQSRQTIESQMRRYQEALKVISGTRQDQAVWNERFGSEFDALMRVPKIKKISVLLDGTIVVETRILYCLDPRSKKLHELGRFKISIKKGADIPVCFLNLTRRVKGYGEGMNAPHVFPDGHACLGNAAETLNSLLVNHEYLGLVMYAIQYLESVNTDDSAGKHISNWPLADQQVVVALAHTFPDSSEPNTVPAVAG